MGGGPGPSSCTGEKGSLTGKGEPLWTCQKESVERLGTPPGKGKVRGDQRGGGAGIEGRGKKGDGSIPL